MLTYLKELIVDLFYTGGRLRNKLFFMIVAIALTPLISVSFLSLYTNTLSHKNDVATIEDNVLFQKSVEIQNFIDEILGIFEISLNIPVEQLVVKEDNQIRYTIIKEQLDTLLQTILEEKNFVEEVFFIDSSTGLEIAKKQRSFLEKIKEIDQEMKLINERRNRIIDEIKIELPDDTEKLKMADDFLAEMKNIKELLAENGKELEKILNGIASDGINEVMLPDSEKRAYFDVKEFLGGKISRDKEVLITSIDNINPFFTHLSDMSQEMFEIVENGLKKNLIIGAKELKDEYLDMRSAPLSRISIEECQFGCLIKMQDGVKIMRESATAANDMLLDIEKNREKIINERENDDLLNNLSKLSYFTVVKNGNKYVSEVLFTTKGPMVIVASPVKNQAGRVIGILAGQINLLGIQKIVSRTQFGNSGYLYVVDREGRIVASSRERGQLKPANLSHLALISDVLLGKDHIGAEGQERFASFWNEQVIGAGKKLRSLDLSLIAEWPVTDADGFINIIRNYMILFSVITLLLILISSIFISHRIVHPIEILEKGAERISKGNFEEPVSIITRDEIERLGTAFNSMMKGLKEFQQLKDEFVFIAAHELRTPVTAIRGYLSMIEDGDAGPVSQKMKEYLDPVVQSNMRLVTLVNDLLEVARQEAGRITIQTVKIDNLGPAISAVIKELKPLADEKQITVLYDDRAVKPVMADESRIKEVVVNLLSNAVKYTLGSGKVSIWHDTRENMLVTHVKDSGIGIPKEAQAKLFEKFYRVQDERLRHVTGTGLGLFIIKQLIEKMGGKIWFVSEPGQGTTFSFSLPLT